MANDLINPGYVMKSSYKLWAPRLGQCPGWRAHGGAGTGTWGLIPWGVGLEAPSSLQELVLCVSFMIKLILSMGLA